MEECDELCGRLGIMVNGQFQCFGPTRYLKNKFGQGFTLLTKLDTSGKSGQEATQILESFKEYVIAKFDGCLVKDEHKVIFFKGTFRVNNFVQLFRAFNFVMPYYLSIVNKERTEY